MEEVTVWQLVCEGAVVFAGIFLFLWAAGNCLVCLLTSELEAAPGAHNIEYDCRPDSSTAVSQPAVPQRNLKLAQRHARQGDPGSAASGLRLCVHKIDSEQVARTADSPIVTPLTPITSKVIAWRKRIRKFVEDKSVEMSFNSSVEGIQSFVSSFDSCSRSCSRSFWSSASSFARTTSVTRDL